MSSFNTDRVVKHVLLIIAMEAEAKHLMEDLKLNKVEATTANCPAMYHTGMYKDCLVSVVTNGKCKTTGVDLVGTNGGMTLDFS